VPEDRFGDLGEPDRPSAGERLADLDRTHPEEAPNARPPRRREPGRSYMWVVGVAGVIAIVVVAVNSLPNAGRGSSGPQVGKPMPRFAAPSAAGDLDGDPNVKQSRTDTNTTNKTPACEVPDEGALRICDYYRTKPVVLTFIVPGAKDCEGYLDRVQRIQASFPKVSFVAVVSGVGREKVASVAKDHGWTFPVAVDQNLGVFNLYRVAVCATSVFARRGGVVQSVKVEAQQFSDAQLRAAIRATTVPR
jgi:peroxiredoxin